MKTLIEVHKEGKYFVAVDLLTNVADQGLSEEAAVQNLKKGLEEHYQLLIELTPRNYKLSYLLSALEIIKILAVFDFLTGTPDR
jgi:hypothetical protein